MNEAASQTGATAPSEAENLIIAEFEKNSRETVRISLTEYRGQQLLDVRAFYPSGGEMKPGKGLTIRRDLVTTLRKALQAAEKATKGEGKAEQPAEA